MDNIYKLNNPILLLLFLLTLASSALADQYPAVATTGAPYHAVEVGSFSDMNSACNVRKSAYYPVPVYTISGLTCTFVNANGTYTYTFLDTVTLACPNGGEFVGGTVNQCYNAPSCLTPTIRKTVTPYSCFTPAECRYPETDNGSGICANNSCPVGQNRNPVLNICQTPPVCGVTEQLNQSTNLCELKKLPCPGHTHASTAQDACLADAPLTCPFAMHDDGTYQCVANDALPCKSNQTSGSIFGVAQCINKTNVDEFARQAQIVADREAASRAQAQAADDAAAASAAAAAADPANQAKSNQASADAATAAAARAANNKDQIDSVKANNSADSASLKAIADSTKEMNEREKATEKAGWGETPARDAITNNAWSGSVGYTAISGQCPAPYNITTTHGNIIMSYQPYCDFATAINPLVLAAAFLAAALLVTGTIRES